MPQYMLSVWFDEQSADADLDDPDTRAQMARTGEFIAEMEREGVWLFHSGLRSPASATVVRSSGGAVSMTDGPFAETKEQLAGFWMIEVPDFDAALAWAAKGSAACGQPVEVRPTYA